MATNQPILRGLATINFYADDLAAAQKWYSQLLGMEAYYAFPSKEDPAYIEFRIGDYQHELGFINSKYAPKGALNNGGAVALWHVDDIEAVYARLIELGAKPYQPITKYGEEGFITASVTDPFGNILGIMYNPHYLRMIELLQPAG